MSTCSKSKAIKKKPQPTPHSSRKKKAEASKPQAVNASEFSDVKIEISSDVDYQLPSLRTEKYVPNMLIQDNDCSRNQERHATVVNSPRYHSDV